MAAPSDHIHNSTSQKQNGADKRRRFNRNCLAAAAQYELSVVVLSATWAVNGAV
jgi:hypothetical protein